MKILSFFAYVLLIIGIFFIFLIILCYSSVFD